MSPLRVEVVTAERTVLETEADMVILPGADGQLGILPKHAALITSLSPGEIRLKKGGAEQSLVVAGGFVEVRNDKVTILADAAEKVEEIDVARAEAAMRRAQETIKAHPAAADLATALAAMRRANVRVKVARRKRGGPGGPGPGA
jgi:F-type H+-transporting ATPase subunit epsilon